MTNVTFSFEKLKRYIFKNFHLFFKIFHFSGRNYFNIRKTIVCDRDTFQTLLNESVSENNSINPFLRSIITHERVFFTPTEFNQSLASNQFPRNVLSRVNTRKSRQEKKRVFCDVNEAIGGWSIYMKEQSKDRDRYIVFLPLIRRTNRR